MTTDSIRQALHAQPFAPFTLRLTDGRAFEVSHPELLLAPPGARTIVLYLDNDRYNLIDLLHIASIDFGKRRGSQRNGRRRAG
jgi:hypothetical protein